LRIVSTLKRRRPQFPRAWRPVIRSPVAGSLHDNSIREKVDGARGIHAEGSIRRQGFAKRLPEDGQQQIRGKLHPRPRRADRRARHDDKAARRKGCARANRAASPPANPTSAPDRAVGIEPLTGHSMNCHCGRNR